MKALVVKPEYFTIDYKVNYSLEKGLIIDHNKLFSQYDEFIKVLDKLGLEIIEIKQRENMPSMVYCRDWGFVHEDTFFQAKFKPQPRRRESKLAGEIFSEMGYKVTTPPDRDYFNGADFILSDDKFFFGWGKRSAIKSKDFLEQELGEEVIDFKITDHKYDHLDKCLGPIDDHSVIYYLNVLSMIEQAKVYYYFVNPIPISEKDSLLYATSFIRIDDKILFPLGISDYLKEEIKRLDFDIIEIDISEYLKAGQGMRSLALLF